MEININEKYEIAYDFYGKMFETVDADSLNERISIAIEKTIQCMSALIDDAEGLKNYLLSRISREKEEETVSVMLGEEAENSIWWDEYRAENAGNLKFWNRYSKYLFERKHWEKSMWIHPISNRAVSAREAARLQSFPDDYIFYGTKDSVYQQIGNAVPPVLGRAIAEVVLSLLKIEVKKEETLKGIYEEF